MDNLFQLITRQLGGRDQWSVGRDGVPISPWYYEMSEAVTCLENYNSVGVGEDIDDEEEE